MTANDTSSKRVAITVENIGGITAATETFTNGVTLLTGANATNRSSFLRGIMAAVGSTDVSLHTGAEAGRAMLELNDATHTARVERTGDGNLRVDGDPLLDETSAVEAAELFAFLMQDNPVRRAVRAGADEAVLREVLMRPVDTAELERELSAVRDAISELEAEQARMEECSATRQGLRERRAELESHRDELDERVADIKAEIDRVEGDVDAAADRDDKVAELRAELTAAHDELAAAKAAWDDEHRRLTDLQERHATLEEELETYALPDADQETLQERRAAVAAELDGVERDLDRVATMIDAHETYLTSGDGNEDAERAGADVIESGHVGAPETVLEVVAPSIAAGDAAGGDADSTGAAASSLLNALGEAQPDADESVCWACGQRVAVERVESVLAAMHDAHDTLRDRRDALTDEIDEIEAQLSRLRERRDEHARLEQERTEVEAKIDEAERTIQELDAQIEAREQDVADIETQLEDASLSERHERLLELHDDLGAARQERDDIQRQIDAVEADIADAEDAAERLDALEAELREKRAERDALKNRVREVEQSIVDTFNEHIAAVLEKLQFNIERVWIERRYPDAAATDTNTATGHAEASVFDVHVARAGEDGMVHADSIDNLSESEREIVGMIVALAGYLAHEVYEDVPFVVLDAVEALDADRLGVLLKYFDEYADCTVAAVLDAHTDAADLDAQADTVIAAERASVAD